MFWPIFFSGLVCPDECDVHVAGNLELPRGRLDRLGCCACNRCSIIVPRLNGRLSLVDRCNLLCSIRRRRMTLPGLVGRFSLPSVRNLSFVTCLLLILLLWFLRLALLLLLLFLFLHRGKQRVLWRRIISAETRPVEDRDARQAHVGRV